jgi:hypothetical protein
MKAEELIEDVEKPNRRTHDMIDAGQTQKHLWRVRGGKDPFTLRKRDQRVGVAVRNQHRTLAAADLR